MVFSEKSKKNSYWLIIPVLLGTVLRLWQLPQQIVLQDEWHAVSAAVKQSFGYIATHFQIADNCIPLSLFYKFLLETTGLSEFGLRFPPLLFGLLLLILLPLSVRRLLPGKDYLLFAFLLALSPLLIHYTRFARPYIIAVFLSFTAVIYFYKWRTEQQNKFLFVYLTAGVTAVWFSLPVFPVVTAPLVFFFFKAFQEKPASAAMKKIILAGLLFLAGFGLWFIPAASSLEAVTGKMQAGTIQWMTAAVSLQLFTGSGLVVFTVLFLILAAAGMTEIAAGKPVFFGLVLTIFSLHFLSLLIIQPLMIEAPIVLTRYSIGLVPFWLMAAAAGLGKAGRLLKKTVLSKTAANVIAGIFLAVYFSTGPVPPVFLPVNNFTNHPHFNWDPALPVIKAEEKLHSKFSEFYSVLKNREENVSIIECPYPFTAWYHLYQLHHQRRVKIGHLPESLVAGAGQIQDDHIHFHHFINIFDRREVKKSGTSFIIIHKDVYAERTVLEADIRSMISRGIRKKDSPQKQKEYAQNRNRLFWRPARKQALRAMKTLPGLYGPPVFEDKYIQVFKVEQ